MALPTILAPSVAPVFLAAGHEFTETGAFSEVPVGTGHSRMRRTRTTTERVVSVRWFLEAAALAAVESWFELDLKAGSLPFTARVASQEGAGLVYWAARWISFECELLHYGRGRVSGSLLLIGEPSETGPELGELALEATIALQATGTATIPSDLALEAVIALEALSGDLTMQLEATIALEAVGELYLTELALEAVVALDATGTATITTGPCSPFTVLSDSGITIGADTAISAGADSGGTFDACRELI